eukprot:GHVT01075010.1.p1 GENE.GHVT01075010.1~~GHVT01075010.1.p1  ORF type:complete len:494 (+),score=106.41 GHVT01075010.1:304-1785(+)
MEYLKHWRKGLKDEHKLAGEETTRIISTDFLTLCPKYSDTRTVIYIWGIPPIDADCEDGQPQVVDNLDMTEIAGAEADGGMVGSDGNSLPSSSLVCLEEQLAMFGYTDSLTGKPGGPAEGPSAAGAGEGLSRPGAVATRRASIRGAVAPDLAQQASSAAALPPTGRRLNPNNKFTEGPAAFCYPVIITSLDNVRIAHVAVGDVHVLFGAADGAVYSYGQNPYGQLGLGHSIAYAKEPWRVKGIAGPVTTVAAGSLHSAAINAAGDVYCWGDGACVGDGTGEHRFLPTLVPLEGWANSSPVASRPASPAARYAPCPSHSSPPPALAAAVLAAAAAQTMVVTSTGRLYVWGETFFSSFFHVPCFFFDFHAAFVSSSETRSSSSGRRHDGAEVGDGIRVVAGAAEVPDGSSGPLCAAPGSPDRGAACTVEEEAHIVQLEVGHHFALALTSDGRVFGWGDGTYGELGMLGGVGKKAQDLGGGASPLAPRSAALSSAN